MTTSAVSNTGPQGPPGPQGPAGGLSAFGSWSQANTVSISTNNSPTVATFSTADVTPVGVSLVANSQITVQATGLYEFTCSPQLHINSGNSSDITFWPRTGPAGPNNVPNSASTQQLGNTSRFALPFVNYFIQLNAGDYVEFCFHGVGDSPEMYGAPAQAGPPAIPAEPALIVTVKRIN